MITQLKITRKNQATNVKKWPSHRGFSLRFITKQLSRTRRIHIRTFVQNMKEKSEKGQLVGCITDDNKPGATERTAIYDDAIKLAKVIYTHMTTV